MYEWVEIENKFAGRCVECKYEIAPGENCLWMRGLGIKHKECPTGIEEDKSQLVIIDEEDKEKLGWK